MRGLQGPIKRATPTDHGWKREPKLDQWIQEHHAGWQTWRTPENVIMGLPPDCVLIGLQSHRGPRGVTPVCVEPQGVFSLWKRDQRSGANYFPK
jgi:hypothetical protein